MDVRMIAHDLSRPLDALTYSLEFVKIAADDDARLQALELAEKNIAALRDIVAALLATSVTGKGRLEFESWRPTDLVVQAMDQVKPIAVVKALRLETDEEKVRPVLSADGSRVVRVLGNLLTNAIRFSPRGGVIRLVTRPEIHEGCPVVVFSVIDEGPGISPEKVEAIFAKEARDGKSATGMGLTVCREIVEAHGGKIWVEAGRAEGAVFSFSIPVREKREESAG